MGGRGRWVAKEGLNPLLGLFGLAIWVPEVPVIGPNMLEWHNRCLPVTGVNFRPMPSM